jgi:hypothetical protein
MSIFNYYPAAALAAVIGGVWGYSWLQGRRFRKAIAEAAAKLDGTYKPGGHRSGGTLDVKSGGRGIVFDFKLSHSNRPESTTVMTTLTGPVAQVELKGRDAVARVPRLAPYIGRILPVKVSVHKHLLSVEVFGVVRRADRLVDLASIVSALAAEMETH